MTFDQLLNMFWIRPETALWREIDIRAMQSFEFSSPSLDMGCGDGTFSFIRAGGEYDLSYDAFRSVGDLNKFFDNIDVFDHYDETAKAAAVAAAPNYKIDVGFDHKENLLKKAAQLGLYNELKQGDANLTLPFEDNSFNSIFSNIVYWLDDPQAVLKEIHRILKPGGRVCLMLPNSTLPEFSFYRELCVKKDDPKWAFLEMMDRGRFADNIRQAKSTEEWTGLFENAGLNIVEHQAHLSKTVIQIWDIGMRPLFPALRKMIDAIDPEKSAGIKEEWVAIFKGFLEPLVEMDGELGQGEEPAFHCFIGEK